MVGFFKTSELDNSIDPRKPLSCASCGLYKNCNTSKMKPYGKNKKSIMFIGSFLSPTDDKRGKPFQGVYGRALQNILSSLNFDLFNDAVCLNAYCCYSEEQVTPFHVDCCRQNVLRAIEKYQPKIIVLLGDNAIKSIIANSWKKKIGDINTWRGFIIPDRNFNAFIAPIYDPKFVYTRKNEKLAEKIWIKDIANILQKIGKELPVLKQTEKCIQYITSDEEFDAFLPVVEKSNIIAFDFETTSLKPYYSKQKIVCTSIAVSDTKVFVFMNTPYRNKKFSNIIKKRKILKIAHNLQMEDKWCNVKLKTKVKGWLACTMNNVHILDNRSDITSLKYQVYIHFGVADYDSLIFSFLEADPKKGAYGQNKIYEFIKKYGEKALMKYCALDSLYTFGLYLIQKEQFDKIED